MIRKWYFAVNESGARGIYDRLIRAAVRSCRANTRLQPICLYDGGDIPLLDWLAAHGVTVIRHRVSIAEAIDRWPPMPNWDAAIARGACLRIDLPLIETEDEFVLYTDSDVLFLSDLGSTPEPEFFACAPEFAPDDWSYVNTGAMIVNVPAMRREHAAFAAFAAANLHRLHREKGPAYDQNAYNAFFAGRWTRLPLDLNWKPYWGIARPRIVHFHGPKPMHIDAILRGAQHLPPVLHELVEQDRMASAYWLGCWNAFDGIEDPVRGFVDTVIVEDGVTRIGGWAADRLGRPVARLRVYADGLEIAHRRAEVAREDVARAGAGDVRCGFELLLAGEIGAPHVVAGADTVLPRSMS